MNKKKILITGLPHSGKSTLIKKLTENIEAKQGFITLEILENNQRTGFKIVTDKGTESVLASIKFDTVERVSKYGVNVSNLETILDEVSVFTKKDFLYLDEIGQMELFSERFKELVKAYIDSDNNFIGSISKVYSDSFIRSISNNSNIDIYEITPETRDEIYSRLREMIT